MHEPFLLAHQVLPQLYLISSHVGPISIRDQMVRGRLVVERALEQGLIWRAVERPSDSRPLLVVGGGAGGVAAALRAVELGVRTWLVDRHDTLFHVQSNITTRWLDPSHSEWPPDHWTQGRFPWSEGVRTNLPWTAGIAGNIAEQWRQIVREIQAANSSLFEVALKTEVTLLSPDDAGGLHVSYSADGRAGMREAMLGVWAGGFQREMCEVVRCDPSNPGEKTVVYAGPPFWATDHLAEPNCGVVGAPARVLIAGAGDGGLQDLLRIVGSASPAFRELAVRTNTPIHALCAAGGIYRRCDIPREVEQIIHSAEDRARRHLLWLARDHSPSYLRDEHAVQAALQATHQRAVERALRMPEVYHSLEELFPEPPPDVRLVHRCTHFTNEYALNRFLVLLLAAYFERSFGRADLLLPGRGIVNMASDGSHTCMLPGQPTLIPNPACYGAWHTVTLQSYAACVAAPDGPVEVDHANVIVIRYGLEPPRIPLPDALLHHATRPRPMQALPYEVPLT